MDRTKPLSCQRAFSWHPPRISALPRHSSLRPKLLLTLILSFFLVSLSLAAEKPPAQLLQKDTQQIAEAELAFNGKDYLKAASLYQVLAAQNNNPFAQYQLGYLYLHGYAVEKDYQLAFNWFKKAADQKLPEAQFALGLMYYYGLGVAQDLNQAVAYFQKSVIQPEQINYAPAAYMLGYLSSAGYGLLRDPAAAIDWYSKAAALNWASAQYNLALLYYSGSTGSSDLQQDYKKAFQLFLAAASQSLVKAQFMTGLMYSLGQGVAEDRKQAAYWYAQAAASGLDAAQYNLGVMYFSGEDLPSNRAFGLQLISKAAASGLSLAEYLMGYVTMNGTGGVAANPQQAIQWYQKSAQQGLGEAQFALGYYYYKGIGVPQDNRQALTWFYAAAKTGMVNAQYMLGVFYQEGLAVAVDTKMAAYWYNQAALQGMENAQLMLGLMYAQGKGVPRDNELAYAWFNLAAASPNPTFKASVLQVREQVARSMGPSEILLAKQLSQRLEQQVKLANQV